MVVREGEEKTEKEEGERERERSKHDVEEGE